MAKSRIIHFRRKAEGKTDYKKRLKLLMAEKPRLVVRKSLNYIWMQISEYSPKGDRIIASAHSKELKKLGWKMGCCNIPAAYLTGMLLGKKAAGKKVKECILDIGLQPSIKGSRLYAALKGFADSGIKVPFSEEIAPSGERIKGEHIAGFAKKAKEGKYKNQFSALAKSNANPEEITKHFEELKQKIAGN